MSPIRTMAAVLAVSTMAGAASAQISSSSGMSQFQNGYGGARQSVASAQTGSTRDENGNRLIVDGIIQPNASSYTRQSGVSQQGSGAAYGSGATAIGNNLNVVVQGSHNTVIVNSSQTNSGAVTARNDLTGRLAGFE